MIRNKNNSTLTYPSIKQEYGFEFGLSRLQVNLIFILASCYFGCVAYSNGNLIVGLVNLGVALITLTSGRVNKFQRGFVFWLFLSQFTGIYPYIWGVFFVCQLENLIKDRAILRLVVESTILAMLSFMLYQDGSGLRLAIAGFALYLSLTSLQQRKITRLYIWCVILFEFSYYFYYEGVPFIVRDVVSVFSQ